MRFLADLHLHSKYSRATSRDCDLEHLASWGLRKGVAVIATGDFTHPLWFEELREKLVPAEPGLFRLRPDLERAVLASAPRACAHEAPRFALSVEISTIYKRGEKTRKVHHVLYAPDLEQADSLRLALGRIGNLASDGRPILGLDSRDLLEIALESGEGIFLVPAHIWTPWFSALGSKSGFDAIDACYADLAGHIFAVETGLSSDPAMNFRVSSLDRYRLISNSDAHSPQMLGREANCFDCDLDFFAMRRALETGEGFGGTLEFFPEEGKYHLDGHRGCALRLTPEQTRTAEGRCPKCGGLITVGVLHRVEALADRPEGVQPEGAAPFESLVPLPELISEIEGVGVASQRVRRVVEELTARLGPELTLLRDVPIEDVRSVGPALLGEALHRLRSGQVRREAGYDGEYGTIRLFEPGELSRSRPSGFLFELPAGAVKAREPVTSMASESAEPAARCGREENGVLGGSAVAGASAQGPSDILVFPNPASIDEPTPKDAASRAPILLSSDGAPLTQPAALEGACSTSAAPFAQTTPRLGGKALPGQASLGAPSPGCPDRAPCPFLDALDPDQRSAAAVTAGPLLIVAGPGTGKTRTLTHRFAHLVSHEGVDPARCLAITFTRKAAGELRERLHQLVPDAAPRMSITTFHGLGLDILRAERERFGLPPDFQLVEEEARRRLAETCFQCSPREADKALEAMRLDPESETRRRFRSLLDARGLVDFDGLIERPLEAFTEDSALAEKWRDRFEHVAIDEYQDIDARQYRLVEFLAPGASNLCAIGDPDQAIYGFRGASVGFFLRFAEDHPGARRIQLTRNYRSSAPIVTAALEAIAPSSLVPGRRLLPSRREERPGSDAPPVTLHTSRSAREEAAWIVQAIEARIGGTSHLAIDTRRALPGADAPRELGFSDFAILYRTDLQSMALMEALTQGGIPFQKCGHDRLLSRRGVRALADALRHEELQPEEGALPLSQRLLALARARIEAEPELEPEIATALDLLKPIAEREATPMAFAEALSQALEVDALDARAERVSLLTLHAAKGLEFPIVFLTGCEDGLLPLRLGFAPLSAEALAEERRLFFVGMTRARDELVLTRAQKRSLRGEERDMAESPFLASIEGRHLERQDAPSRHPRRRVGRQLKLF